MGWVFKRLRIIAFFVYIQICISKLQESEPLFPVSLSFFLKLLAQRLQAVSKYALLLFFSNWFIHSFNRHLLSIPLGKQKGIQSLFLRISLVQYKRSMGIQINIMQNGRCFNRNMDKGYRWRVYEKASTKGMVLRFTNNWMDNP